MRHVAAADREAVAVAAGDEHQQIGIRELDALRDRQRAAVHAVEAVRRGVAGNAARAADARDERDLVRRAADRRQRAVDRLDDAEVAAAGAPDRLQVALVVLGLVRSIEGTLALLMRFCSPILPAPTSATRRACSVAHHARAAAPRSSSGVIGFDPLRASGSTPRRHVHEHPQQPVQLPLVRLLDHEPGPHRREEVLVDLLRDRIEQLGHQQLRRRCPRGAPAPPPRARRPRRCPS